MAVARIHRRIAFAAAAALGNGCAGFRPTHPSGPSLFAPSFVGRAFDLSGRQVRGQRCGVGFVGCSRYEGHLGHRLFMSTVDRSEEVLEFATYDSNEEDDVSNEEDDVNNEEIESDANESRSSLLYEALSASIQSSLNNLSKKTASLERELAKAQSLEETMARANLLVSNLYRLPPGTASAEVEDWENDGQIVTLELNTKEYASAQEESDALFALARKMKRGSKVVEELMEKSFEGEEILKDAILDLESLSGDDAQLDEGRLVLIQERLQRTSKKTGFKSPNLDANSEIRQNSGGTRTNKRSDDKAPNKPSPRELISPSGLKVLVGRNRRDNEAICFKLSKPTDIWMHSRGCPGAHVLLCVRRGSPDATDEDLQFAADLAAFYSDARTELRAEITTAAPKHITKPRGAPLGAVSLRQEGKTLLGRPGDVAEDLKEAREKSGAAWDEMGYRKLGTRAKNKKRTAAVEKAKKAKNREEAKGKSKRRKRKEEQDFY